MGFYRFLSEQRAPVAGLISGRPERAAEITRTEGIPCYTSVAEMRTAHPGLEVMVVANANDQHLPAAREALEAGLHVYCEKPMAPTLEESRDMLAAEAASAGTLQIGFEYIHSLMPRRVRTLMEEGAFGEVLTAGCVDSRGHWWADAPDTPFEQQVRLRRDAGGGIIYHCGIHQLDMLRAYLGEFEEVQAYRAGRNGLSFYPGEVPDHVTVMLKGREGRLGQLEIFHNRAPTYYRRPLPEGGTYSELPGHEFRLSLTGTKGSCLADFYGGKLHIFRFDHERKETEWVRTEDYSDRPQNDLHHDMNGMLLRYLERIQEGSGPITPATDAYATMVLATATERSIVENRSVRIQDEFPLPEPAPVSCGAE
jgi:predicted dehydrogenase